MAFNYPNYFNQFQQAQMPQQAPQPQLQQASGFVPVRSEMEARNYPVAYGNSVTFKDENAPYIYTKTMGFSQLDRPTFDKYKLVKEEAKESITEQKPTQSEIEKIQSEIKNLWIAIREIREDDEYGA